MSTHYSGAIGVLAAALMTIAIAVGWHAAPAHACAVDPDTGETTCGPPPPPPGPNCVNNAWKTPPRIVIHVSEFLSGEGLFGPEEKSYMVDDVQDTANRFNEIGATTAAVAKVTTSNEPFAFGTWAGDTTPTINVGFTDDITRDAGENAGGATRGAPRLDAHKCAIEQQIVFPTRSDPIGMTWDFLTPLSAYRPDTCKPTAYQYYDAGQTDCSGATWFRPSFQHELLHAFGLKHTTSQYSFMNHRGDGGWNLTRPAGYVDTGGFPWANRDADRSVLPLPYEVGELRRLYPGSGSRYDIAALNTWYRPADVSDDAAWQMKLCVPSLGASWSADTSSGTCGVDGKKDGATTVFSPGSTLRTRFALANYSTGSLDVTSKLWLSKDETWDPSDVPVDADESRHLDAATSRLVNAKWTLPELCSGEYHPIVHLIAMHYNADGSADPASLKMDWIPLRGTITSTWGCKLHV